MLRKRLNSRPELLHRTGVAVPRYVRVSRRLSVRRAPTSCSTSAEILTAILRAVRGRTPRKFMAALAAGVRYARVWQSLGPSTPSAGPSVDLLRRADWFMSERIGLGRSSCSSVERARMLQAPEWR